MFDLSTMYPLMNSANFATLKLNISTDMVLVKAVPLQRRKRSRETVLTSPGERLICATFGMRGSVDIKHPHANSGMCARFVEDPIPKDLVTARRTLTPNW